LHNDVLGTAMFDGIADGFLRNPEQMAAVCAS
jgi:hypothetical protein